MLAVFVMPAMPAMQIMYLFYLILVNASDPSYEDSVCGECSFFSDSCCLALAFRVSILRIFICAL